MKNVDKYLNKFYGFVEKIGKPNFILIVFIFIVILVTGLYQTFSLYTEGGGFDIVDGLKTYRFVLMNDNENSVTIAAESSKNIMITVSNHEEEKLKYGIYYSTDDDLSLVNIGYLETSKYSALGLIDAKSDYIVTLKIENNSTNNVTITFGTKYGYEDGGDFSLDENQTLVTKYTQKLLSGVKVGSYVSYVGNNKCDLEHCNGTNANYVDDTNMGYCGNIDTKFNVNGWRVAYIQNGTAYLISAGSPECLCTKGDGSVSDTLCESDELVDGIPLHIDNLNKKALTYCNMEFAYGGVCNGHSAWNMSSLDYNTIVDNIISACYGVSNETCGLNNDLIDVGSNYWYANAHEVVSTNAFTWNALSQNIDVSFTSGMYGIRPIIRMADTVYITDGDGSYENPYVISNTIESVSDIEKESLNDKSTESDETSTLEN